MGQHSKTAIFVAPELPGSEINPSGMSTKVTLTDKFITSPRRVPKVGRVDYWDAVVPGFGLRVTRTAHRSFILAKRFPLNPEHPTRRAIGDDGALSLDQGRQVARRWLELISKGIDPRLQEARDKAAEQTKAANTFATLWSDFYEHHASQLTKADEAKRAGTAFVKLWGIRPAAEIEPAEIAAHIRTIAKRAPSEARNRLGHLRRMYSWGNRRGRPWHHPKPVRGAQAERPCRPKAGPRPRADR